MDAKHCIHIKTDIGINREYIKTKKNENKIFECLGKFFFSFGFDRNVTSNEEVQLHVTCCETEGNRSLSIKSIVEKFDR